MNTPSPFVLALDVGGGHVTAAIVNTTARALHHSSVTRIAIPHDAPALDLVHAWANVGLHALAAADSLAVTGIGIAMPGPFDYAQGVSLMTRKFRALHGLNVRRALRNAWQDGPLANAPIRFENDAALFALGEWWGGAARGAQRVVGITLGTGFGSGFVRSGVTLHGGHGVPDGGTVWHLPLRGGVAEDFISGAALTHAYQQRAGRHLTPERLADAAFAGDSEARTVFTHLGYDIAEVLAPVLNAFHAERLVLGGNLSRAFTLFQSPLQTELRLHAPGVHVTPTDLYETAALLGAAALFIANSDARSVTN
ncbi:ROK family protein [Deinococcus yavapaiensis]|uniref:Glucokinase n=1 Tax=Deinococcus yavapaiensis KR-236 TaxID=694435 RepID=A0A318S3M6_9DEIO|nr:ROK family protein [Deinococcus yavapaiensis]PYE50969.1 glucokinase [Deinococcus yavapaiensis KR-236]